MLGSSDLYTSNSKSKRIGLEYLCCVCVHCTLYIVPVHTVSVLKRIIYTRSSKKQQVQNSFFLQNSILSNSFSSFSIRLFKPVRQWGGCAPFDKGRYAMLDTLVTKWFTERLTLTVCVCCYYIYIYIYMLLLWSYNGIWP